ncbi:DUF4232 domain-containing protein [Saccharopolyspora sp. NPDC000359]|uniref:DUF4232 domain-containing protein n=1 Tax=Saccharopolyspora sp. NPDC000359 TaxID=3154251 RepID=UPI00331A29DE
MLHLRTTATALSAVALAAGLSSCASGSEPAPSGQNPGIAVGEPAPGQVETARSEETEQAEGSSTEQPDDGEGSGFGKCTADTLSVRVEHHGDEDVARSADLFIANVGTEACNLPGFPQLEFYNDQHEALSIDVSQNGSTQELLEIKPGERFTAPLGWSSSPEFAPCQEPVAVAVFPPNTSEAKETPWTGGKICANGVSIDPYARA